MRNSQFINLAAKTSGLDLDEPTIEASRSLTPDFDTTKAESFSSPAVVNPPTFRSTPLVTATSPQRISSDDSSQVQLIATVDSNDNASVIVNDNDNQVDMADAPCESPASNDTLVISANDETAPSPAANPAVTSMGQEQDVLPLSTNRNGASAEHMAEPEVGLQTSACKYLPIGSVSRAHNQILLLHHFMIFHAA
jgi:hypothetical protein